MIVTLAPAASEPLAGETLMWPTSEDPAVPERRRYLLAGLLACETCGRRMKSAWSNGKPAYRCRHGHTSAASPDPGRPKNAYVRGDRVMPRLAALHLLWTSPVPRARRRTRRPSAGGRDGRAKIARARRRLRRR